MRMRWVWTGMAAVTTVGMLAQPVGAESSKSLEMKVGRAEYMRYCSTCHGPDADGNGVASSLFNKKPTNLTLLAKNNGGTFPTEKLLSIVRGDAAIAAHGKREMPVWGEIIGRPQLETMDSQAVADSRLMAIANYLRTLQKK